MPTYDYEGKERAEAFLAEMQPENLAYELKSYQKVLGKEFGIRDLLAVKSIESHALMAACIGDAPEILCDQIGKARHYKEFNSIASGIEAICDELEEIVNNL